MHINIIAGSKILRFESHTHLHVKTLRNFLICDMMWTNHLDKNKVGLKLRSYFQCYEGKGCSLSLNS